MGESLARRFGGTFEAREGGAMLVAFPPLSGGSRDIQAQIAAAQEAARFGADEPPLTPNLDLSPEARKARAEQMGFTTVAYHGTGSPGFSQFDPSRNRWDNGAIWFTDQPTVANQKAFNWVQREGTTERWNKE